MRGFSEAGSSPIEGRARVWRYAALPALLNVLLTAEDARAEEALRGLEASPSSLPDLTAMGGDGSATIVLALLLAAITIVMHLAARRKWSRRTADLEAEVARTRAKLDRAALIMQGDRQIVVTWDRPDAQPAVEGDLALVATRRLRRKSLTMPAGWGMSSPHRSWKRRSGSSIAASPSRSQRSAVAAGMLKSAAGRCQAAPSCASGTCREIAWSSRKHAKG